MSTENRDSELQNGHSEQKNRHLLRAARITLGVVFLLLGIIGSLLPVLQGWLFFLLALITFFPGHPRVKQVLDKAEPKLPRTVRFLRKLGIGVGE
ncbi:MAG: hypothetical protein R3338_05170 [Thermoanaerobaculia bacterium]|nr:hypothetical protein [Thermoanaerobaculia bacterium]